MRFRKAFGPLVEADCHVSLPSFRAIRYFHPNIVSFASDLSCVVKLPKSRCRLPREKSTAVLVTILHVIFLDAKGVTAYCHPLSRRIRLGIDNVLRGSLLLTSFGPHYIKLHRVLFRAWFMRECDRLSPVRQHFCPERKECCPKKTDKIHGMWSSIVNNQTVAKLAGCCIYLTVLGISCCPPRFR